MSTEPVVAKKKKGLKRLKGLITGKTRKEKKLASSRISDLPDDSSTVYGAEIDASVAGTSVSSSAVSAAKNTAFADPVQIILLIMDPSTRRFELLQLEFDSAMAKVSDIFKQIPTAATEEVLQKSSYKTIITPKGDELNANANLADYFTGAAVVIAVPDSSEVDAQKCANMALPILTNSKVHKMVSFIKHFH